MWPFSQAATKAGLQDHKRVRIGGWRFTIRKLNPFTDFPADQMPQIFAAFRPRREMDPSKLPEPAKARIENQIKLVVHAGVVDPALVPVGKGDLKGKETGMTVEDIFRDPDVGMRLYAEIMAHSLNRFRGLRGVFFSIKIKLWLYMQWRSAMELVRHPSPSPTVTAP